MKVAGYIRVSTEDQVGEDKFGLHVQREEIEEYCQRHGYDLIRIYSDEGVSGATLDRPALIELLDGEDFEKVVVAKYDRLSRDLFGQLYIEKELTVKTVELVSVREPFNGKAPEMELMRQMMGAFAQFEKERITQRLAAGRKAKRQQGGFIGGQAPIGYYSEPGTKKLHVDEAKVATVRRIFELRASGSLAAIAMQLNEEGHTTREGNRFSAMQIKRVYDRELLYRGKMQAPAIITLDRLMEKYCD